MKRGNNGHEIIDVDIQPLRSWNTLVITHPSILYIVNNIQFLRNFKPDYPHLIHLQNYTYDTVDLNYMWFKKNGFRYYRFSIFNFQLNA